MTKKEDLKHAANENQKKRPIKKIGLHSKIIILLSFILLLVFLLLFNKATINSLIPVDYMEDPWPFKQKCTTPEKKEIPQ